LLLPGELARHAISEGTKAVTKYTSGWIIILIKCSFLINLGILKSLQITMIKMEMLLDSQSISKSTSLMNMVDGLINKDVIIPQIVHLMDGWFLMERMPSFDMIRIRNT
jgi:hypothetical protein